MNLLSLAKHFFIPHHGNNHRAKALHIDVLTLYVLAFLVINIGLRMMTQRFPDVLGYATNIQVQELLRKTNEKRIEAGLPPLRLDQQLSQAAAKKAEDMFAKNYWAHVSPDGKTPWDFILASGYKYTVAGENLAKNFQDSAGVVNAWMASPSHRDNILKKGYKDIGFAVMNGKLQGEETTLVVQMFGARPSARPVSQAIDDPTEQSIASELMIADAGAPTNPVEVPQVAASINEIPFPSVISMPQVDVVKVRRDITMVFGGMFLGALLLDIWIMAKKKKVRAVGSSIAHGLFFLAILIASNMIIHGSVL